MSFTELSFSIPASRALFLAGSSTEWKSKYLENSQSKRPLPRLFDVMHDINLLEDHSEDCDINLGYMAVLNGYWGQVRAVGESSRFHDNGGKGESIHLLWIKTQQRELYRELENFRDRLLNAARPESGLIMTAELFLMVLCISPDELQRFAGKSGQDAASQALETLERWSVTESARRAVWHSGQIFRWASLMPPAELRDFYAVVVYFASLALWAYGHLSSPGMRDATEQTRSTRQTDKARNDLSQVNLLGTKSRETKTFISTGQGTPILTLAGLLSMHGLAESGNVSVVPLSSPNAVLKMARNLYRSNFPILEEPLPPLVENLGNLMRDLGSLPENRFSRCASPVEK
jgi:hypothetical protein